MTPERFAYLADAYGADLQRWPVAERVDARTLLERGDATSLLVLQQARQLDSLLDSYQLATPDPALARRIVASAPPARPTSFWSRYADWLSRVGFVGVGLAGIATGMLVASLSLPLPSASEALPSIFDQGDADIVFTVNAEESEQ
ncbi:hypothetical protein HX866_13055 [Pseudomonas gingeri]|uniref:hypothetical protein n=1 Tax=Pseudomonas gingeri TaxID=117681 RepID=UPI00159FD8A7|nr:hypothetical protein [Pseudomonas gingeri]NWA25819.1 hypothetical protein [Pseudomonas gingeri]NWD75782.1 hypothetical protein [Pseudomonas gingeri]